MLEEYNDLKNRIIEFKKYLSKVNPDMNLSDIGLEYKGEYITIIDFYNKFFDL